jgi:hypothetical protein
MGFNSAFAGLKLNGPVYVYVDVDISLSSELKDS